MSNFGAPPQGFKQKEMSDFGAAPQGFKTKGRKNKQKKRNGGTTGKTILGIGAALGTAYAANQAYQGYQGYQQNQALENATIQRQNAEQAAMMADMKSDFSRFDRSALEQGKARIAAMEARNQTMFGGGGGGNVDYTNYIGGVLG